MASQEVMGAGRIMQVINTGNKLITTVFGFLLGTTAALRGGGGVDLWASEGKTKFCTSVQVGRSFIYSANEHLQGTDV